MKRRRGWLVGGVLLAAAMALAVVARSRASAPTEPPPGDEPAASDPTPHPSIGASSIDGRDFPDGVLALTWDDGPDERTLALAKFLNQRKVSATFFVVAEWFAGVSSDPGFGRATFETGYDRIPILPDLLRLGHRLGNHTLHHVLLTEVPPDDAEAEVRENQRRIDPLLTNELRLIRAPGGAWDDTVARALAADPYLDGVVGPLRWDVDRKDWEGATGCASSQPAAECEPASVPGHAQVRPAVVAARYLASIEAARHGIVLFHDRVGHVGSDYALDVARALLPALEARGYVFAAPVLRFSVPALRTPPDESPLHAVGLADV
ncbi:MAG TPA: polysaccharide deacetylase family protein, partial [Polyangiaceae bacterium]